MAEFVLARAQQRADSSLGAKDGAELQRQDGAALHDPLDYRLVRAHLALQPLRVGQAREQGLPVELL